MLTAKENMREVIFHGKPDRFVNQYEAISFLFTPYSFRNPEPVPGGPPVTNQWGVTKVFPGGTPGAFPIHTPETIVVKDIENWKDYVKAPALDFSQEEWDISRGMAAAVDGNKSYKAVFIAPGIFEQSHYLCEIKNALMYFVMNPDEMHELVKYLFEFEMKLAEGICANLHPDAIFHHDDWGTENSTFMSPAMFEDFFVDGYKQLYKYYHDHGVEVIFHHSDAYGATIVPSMIEMGIDVWQGVMENNNSPELIAKYGDKITFMGDIDNKSVDHEGWTPEECEAVALRAIKRCGMKSFIPCITQGGPGSVYPGTYKCLWDAIDKYNCETFGFTQEQLEEQRLPINILFG